jgi:hypothetical protein
MSVDGVVPRIAQVGASFISIKHPVNLQNFDAHSLGGIQLQNRFLYGTICSTAVTHEYAPVLVVRTKHTRMSAVTQKVSGSESKIKDTLVLLLQRSTIGPLLEQLWLVMIQTIEPVRPGRSFPRIKRVKPKKFTFSYKPTR